MAESIYKYKKLIRFLSIGSFFFLLYFAYNFISKTLVTILPDNLTPVLQKASSQFYTAGLISVVLLWMAANFVSLQLSHTRYLIVVFLLAAFWCIFHAYAQETIFKYKQANGLWEGGFSMTYFIAAGKIILIAVLLSINRATLRRLILKQSESLESASFTDNYKADTHE